MKQTVEEIFNQFKLGEKIFFDISTVSKTHYHINSELEANSMFLKILTHKNDLIYRYMPIIYIKRYAQTIWILTHLNSFQGALKMEEI